MQAKASAPPPFVLRLAVPSPLRRTFDYLPPVGDGRKKEAWLPGIRLRVPFGRRVVVALLIGTSRSAGVDVAQLRHALEVLDEAPLFAPGLLRVFTWAVSYYQHPPGEVFQAVLPVRLRQGASTEKPRQSAWIVAQRESDSALRLLKRAPRQQQLFELIRQKCSLTSEECEGAGFAPALLRQLQARGLIESVSIGKAEAPSRSPASMTGSLTANPEQARAIDSIRATLDRFACHLLNGVTGSGKTEVYLQVIEPVLAKGRQALVLVPEIGLTPQTIAMFESRFGRPVAALHSGLNNTERLDGWLRARSGEADIVIGTRSAIFTPLARPGLIIVDEEHDASFKQQDGFRYSARDLAIVRAREEDISIVLGSATPSLETLYNASSGRFGHLELTQRAGDASKPPVVLLDISAQPTEHGFAPDLVEMIEAQLQRGNQVLVFINRRGFAPALFCQECGLTFECTRCDALLTVHRSPPSLHCHHCEYRIPLPGACPECASKRLATRGLGTERTEQFLADRFPGFPVIRIDRDSTRRRNGLHEMLEEIHRGDPCLLVGTQMLAKGHHFPKVTLVAVLDADTGLFSPDFRGQEHMLQLLFQVAGRAGRADAPGRVAVQTRHGTHASLVALVASDYRRIAALLLAERRATGMPPFSHLALIRAESVDARLPLRVLGKIREAGEQILHRRGIRAVELHAPLPAPMEKRAGKFRGQLLLKASSRGALQALLTELCPGIEAMQLARRVRWSVDVDPQDLI